MSYVLCLHRWVSGGVLGAFAIDTLMRKPLD